MTEIHYICAISEFEPNLLDQGTLRQICCDGRLPVTYSLVYRENFNFNRNLKLSERNKTPQIEKSYKKIAKKTYRFPYKL